MSKQAHSEEVLVLHTVAEVRAWRQTQREQNKSVGYVATMGALHAGHLSLVDTAAKVCDSVIVSIFVNPAQFAPNEDLDRYPRTLSEDINKLATATLPTGTTRTVFAPSVAEMYPRGITTDRARQCGTFVEVLGLSEVLEGGTRPHFFRGVATVVTKLFHIIMPDHAFFGQKDAQQCCVLRAMVQDLHFPLVFHVVPTDRDPKDGFALSSRNVYLTPEQRLRAPSFYRGLCRARDLFNTGVVSRETLIAAVEEEADVGALDIEYISLNSPEDLSELKTVGSSGAILSGAWRMGSTRLIDNILIGFKF
ncbi:pantoate-beta-alanine ligase [Coemansia sp. RSA 988]|nr:pantoate-beta-alanine ligase [Coemansia sp. RSA 988]